jgi:hypothetical protein
VPLSDCVGSKPRLADARRTVQNWRLPDEPNLRRNPLWPVRRPSRPDSRVPARSSRTSATAQKYSPSEIRSTPTANDGVKSAPETVIGAPLPQRTAVNRQIFVDGSPPAHTGGLCGAPGSLERTSLRCLRRSFPGHRKSTDCDGFDGMRLVRQLRTTP